MFESDESLFERYLTVKERFDEAKQRSVKMKLSYERDDASRFAGSLNFTLLSLKNEIDNRGYAWPSATDKGFQPKPERFCVWNKEKGIYRGGFTTLTSAILHAEQMWGNGDFDIVIVDKNTEVVHVIKRKVYV